MGLLKSDNQKCAENTNLQVGTYLPHPHQRGLQLYQFGDFGD
jgi:hypothetical protein